MFVKWSCGCIGVRSYDSERTTDPDVDFHDIVLKDCCGDDEPYTIMYKDMSDKDYVWVGASEEIKLIKNLGSLISQGYALRTISMALKHADVE